MYRTCISLWDSTTNISVAMLIYWRVAPFQRCRACQQNEENSDNKGWIMRAWFFRDINQFFFTLLQLTTTNSTPRKPLHPNHWKNPDFLPPYRSPRCRLWQSRRLSTGRTFSRRRSAPTNTESIRAATSSAGGKVWESVDDSYSGRCQYWDASMNGLNMFEFWMAFLLYGFFLHAFDRFFGDHWKTCQCRVLFALTGVTLRGWRVWKPRFQAIQKTPVSWGRNRCKE